MIRNREILLYTVTVAVITLIAMFLCLKIFGGKAALICGLACIVVYGVSVFFTFYRYRKIDQLSVYLQRLSGGGAVMDIRENREGELSILKNEIYRVTTSLAEQAEAFQQDKIELANALSDISHQLKTPLTSIRIMTDLLKNHELPPEKRSEFIDSMRGCQDRMEWLVLSLLKMARLDAGAVTLKKESVSLHVIAEKAIAPMLIPMEIKEQSFSISGEDVFVTCDTDWTIEALGNIIKNAVENTQEGGHIQISYGENPLYAFIAVCDNGKGIAKTDMPHLFKRFYKGKNAGRSSAGIGLSLSLTIMREQNGDIDVESSDGSVFTLKFY